MARLWAPARLESWLTQFIVPISRSCCRSGERSEVLPCSSVAHSRGLYYVVTVETNGETNGDSLDCSRDFIWIVLWDTGYLEDLCRVSGF
jgi:hypothetical protein